MKDAGRWDLVSSQDYPGGNKTGGGGIVAFRNMEGSMRPRAAAGVVGLACARALALSGKETLLIDMGSSFGLGTSSRHSEVIHAGIYYPPGSLKAQLCVEGKHLLYNFCRTRGIPFKRVGKLIVATQPSQLPALVTYKSRASMNGVHDLELMTGCQARELEPSLQCDAALLSPSTGILDSHSYMATLLAEAQAAGAMTAFNTRCMGGDVTGRRNKLVMEDVHTREQTPITASFVVNAAGLHAQRLAGCMSGLPASSIPPLFMAKGNYFGLRGGPSPFSRLIYPVPEDGGLGIHLTLDLAGGARFGPDVEWLARSTEVDHLDYQVDPARAKHFYPAIRSYYPDLPEGALQPHYSGVRPKVSGPGQLASDFMVHDLQHHGVRGLVNLFGIESPGLTASLALADLVLQRLTEGCK